MTEVEKLERTRVTMQQETSAAYLSALRVIGKLEAELKELQEWKEKAFDAYPNLDLDIAARLSWG